MKKPGMILTLVMVCFSVVEARIITVDGNGLGDYTKIQDAINSSKSGDEVVVNPGVYKERINFNGKAITLRSIEPDSIFSSYATVIDGEDKGIVVTFDSGEIETTKIEGLVIQGGKSSGVYCHYSSPIVSKCVVRNSAIGILGLSGSPSIADCMIINNSGNGIEKCSGEVVRTSINNNNVGIYECECVIDNCDIHYNRTNGVYSEIYSSEINNSRIHNNSECGVKFFPLGSLKASLDNCIVSGNGTVGVYCGRIFYLSNCTIVGNRSSGFFCGTTPSGSSYIMNTIIASNNNYGIQMANSASNDMFYNNNIWNNINGNYCNVAAGQTDTHVNPLFAIDGYWRDETTWIEGDYHLKSVAGRWTETGWVNDDVTSPCIDAGDPIGGYLNEPEPNGLRINQGAYGGTEQASRSPWGPIPYCSNYPKTDVNLDCRVDLQDFAVMLSEWLNCNLVPVSACE